MRPDYTYRMLLLALVLPGCAAQMPTRQSARYPLRVRIYSGRWEDGPQVHRDNSCCSTISASGFANLQVADTQRGMRYKVTCFAQSNPPLAPQYAYSARWNRNGRSLQVLMDPGIPTPWRANEGWPTCKMDVIFDPSSR
jgi:hypothetical protein